MTAPATLVALALVVSTTACGGSDPDPKTVATAKDSGGGGGGGGGNGVNKGDKAPGFSLDSLNGAGKVAIAPGKVTIVDFWATWCEPCKKSFPKYQELYVKYKASGLEIVAVSVDDDKGGIPSFVKTYNAKFPVGWDDGHKIADKWKPEHMPRAYIVDKTGVVKFVHKGYHDGEEADIEKELKGLL